MTIPLTLEKFRPRNLGSIIRYENGEYFLFILFLFLILEPQGSVQHIVTFGAEWPSTLRDLRRRVALNAS